MIVKRIWLKNFLSFGEPAVELKFSPDEPLWVLSGPNGVGKSAVFDAITYALFGEHRGGKRKAEQLIRHGANGFEVEFDFEFNANDYRIRRTRPRKGRGTQQLLQRREGEWEPIGANGQPGSVDANDIERWVTETIGLGYEAFTNSVLLQQGKADKLFSASRDDRIAVLKGIIGFEQFEEISRRVHAATARHERAAEAIAAQFASVAPVTDDELATLEKAAADAEAARTAAQESLNAAVRGIGHARDWGKLEQEGKELQRQLAEAAMRQKDAEQIRADKAALDDLTEAVPVLEHLLNLRDRIAALNTERATANDLLDRKLAEQDANLKAADEARQNAARYKSESEQCERRVTDLNDSIARDTKVVGEANAVEVIEVNLKEFPTDLDKQLEDVLTAEGNADQRAGQAATARTQAETLLAQALQQQERFEGVTVGLTCSLCGQPITHEHVANESARLTAEIERLQAGFDNAAADAQTAENVLKTHRSKHKGLEKTKTGRDKLRIERDSMRRSLSTLGDVSSAADLSARLALDQAEKTAAATRKVEQDALGTAEGEIVAKLEQEGKTLKGAITAADAELRRREADLASASGEQSTNLSRLSEKWRIQLPTMTKAALVPLSETRDQFVAAQVAEKFKALEQDDVMRTGRAQQLANIQVEIDGIPPEYRIAHAEAQNRQVVAKAAAAKAVSERDIAVAAHTESAQRKQKYDQLITAHRDAAERHRLHKRLDDLLGQAGLQRELVRDAEEQIVGFANETLQHLSDGELALEEDSAAESAKAFDLSVRRIGGEPIGVAFLSGSQRFRVAVSVALAVGRFASGRARPLEGVIIDEGFGSLDRDGLRAMADELQRLQRESALRRVILVSHQPEFTDYFSVGYALTAGENGSTATPFRR